MFVLASVLFGLAVVGGAIWYSCRADRKIFTQLKVLSPPEQPFAAPCYFETSQIPSPVSSAKRGDVVYGPGETLMLVVACVSDDFAFCYPISSTGWKQFPRKHAVRSLVIYSEGGAVWDDPN